MGIKAVVLNSGGCDSTVALGVAVKNFGAEDVSTLFNIIFDGGNL